MDNKDLMNYFIETTNKRLELMDHKLDKLISFKWQIIGGSIGVSLVVSAFVQVTLIILQHKG